MTWIMLCGNGFCLMGYYLSKKIVEHDAAPLHSDMITLFPAALMELFGEILANIGLVLTKDGGTSQVLDCSYMIWCGLISFFVFQRSLKWFEWTGILLITSGIFIKISIMMPIIFPNYKEKNYCQQEN